MNFPVIYPRKSFIRKEYKLYQRRKNGKKLHNARMDTQKVFNTKNIQTERYTQLFPFYRLGILLFLSLFFTAFSLSLFIAPDTAATKKNTTRTTTNDETKEKFRTIFR